MAVPNRKIVPLLMLVIVTKVTWGDRESTTAEPDVDSNGSDSISNNADGVRWGFHPGGYNRGNNNGYGGQRSGIQGWPWYQPRRTQTYECDNGLFQCSSGECIKKEYVCDSDPTDCADGSDERNCGYSNPGCQFTCSNGDCIPRSYVCDTEWDCSDGSDEFGCSQRTSRSYLPGATSPSPYVNVQLFQCVNGKSILKQYLCDGDRDCIDGSDEVNCGRQSPQTSSARTTSSTQPMTTPRGTTRRSCQPDEIACYNGEKCYKTYYLCDQDPDCTDGSDEIDCNRFSTTTRSSTSTTSTTSTTSRTSTSRPSTLRVILATTSTAKSKTTTSLTTSTTPKTTTSTPTTTTVTSAKSSVCGLADPTGRVIGGENAKIQEFPWIVRLNILSSSGKMSGCGGSIIADSWILTAAHCVVNEQDNTLASAVAIYAGQTQNPDSQDPNAGPNSRLSYTFFPHPNYERTTRTAGARNDFALVKLETPLNTTQSTVKTICLPDKICQDSDDSTATVDGCSYVQVAGWGWLNTTASLARAATTLQKANLKVNSRSNCTNTFSSDVVARDPDAIFCAGQTNSQTCRGDSGGPLMCLADGALNVVGVVSYGLTNCTQNGVYARVCKVLPWIRKVMDENSN